MKNKKKAKSFGVLKGIKEKFVREEIDCF